MCELESPQQTAKREEAHFIIFGELQAKRIAHYLFESRIALSSSRQWLR